MDTVHVLDTWGKPARDDDNHDLSDNQTVDFDNTYIINDGDIDTRRFSYTPRTELSLLWWNKRVDFEVRREPSEHRVLVLDVTTTVWTMHIIIASVVGVMGVGVLSFMLFGKLAYMLSCVAVYALIVTGLIGYERFLRGNNKQIGSIHIMDAIIWEGIKAIAEKQMDSTVDAAKLKARRERKKIRQEHKARVAVAKRIAKDTGEAVVVPDMPYVPKYTDFLTTTASAAPTTDSILEQVYHLCDIEVQQQSERRLRESFVNDTASLEALGRGVVHCECQGCQVAREKDMVADGFGNKEMTPQIVIQYNVANSVINKINSKRDAIRRKSLEKSIAQRDAQRKADIERHDALERKQIARTSLKEFKREQKQQRKQQKQQGRRSRG